MWTGRIGFLEKDIAKEIGFEYEMEVEIEGFPKKADYSNVVITDNQYEALKMVRDEKTDAYWTLEKELNQYDKYSVSENVYITESSGDEYISTIKEIKERSIIENEYCRSIYREIEIRCENASRNIFINIPLNQEDDREENYYSAKTKNEVENEMNKWKKIYKKLSI